MPAALGRAVRSCRLPSPCRGRGSARTRLAAPGLAPPIGLVDAGGRGERVAARQEIEPHSRAPLAPAPRVTAAAATCGAMPRSVRRPDRGGRARQHRDRRAQPRRDARAHDRERARPDLPRGRAHRHRWRIERRHGRGHPALRRPAGALASEPDRGISDAFNKGVAAARGDCIGLLNADDWLEPEQIERAVAALERSGADFVFGDLIYHDRGRADAVPDPRRSALCPRDRSRHAGRQPSDPARPARGLRAGRRLRSGASASPWTTTGCCAPIGRAFAAPTRRRWSDT